jgi:hypothetical protein
VPPQPPAPKLYRGQSIKTWLLLAGAAIVVVLFVIGDAFGDDDDDDDRPASRAQSGGSCQTAVYKVEGGIMDITLNNATGDTEQVEARRDWSKSLGCVPNSQFLYVSAQNEGPGTVECWITRDGVEVAHARSSGEYVIASCSD